MRMSGWAVAPRHTLCHQPPPVPLPESGPQDRRGRQEMRGMPGREWERARKLGGGGCLPSCLAPASARFFFLGPFFSKKGKSEYFPVDDSKAEGRVLVLSVTSAEDDVPSSGQACVTSSVAPSLTSS